MSRKKKAAAVAVAAVMTCSMLAGCDALTTSNVSKDYAQVVATVDLTRSEDFADGGEYAPYKDFISQVGIVKRDMVASYVASGYSIQQQYNWTYADVFNAIVESLVNRQIFVQYAKVYLAKNYKDENGNDYSLERYTQEVVNKNFPSPEAKEAAGLAFFLSPKEKDKADYDLKRSINSAIDSIEEGYIDLEEDEHDHTADSDVRTLPTGAETENEDYYTNDYQIYTGRERLNDLGEYEPVEGSTPTTRKKAYTRFLANLSANDLITAGENTSEFTSLTYYAMEQKSNYETALINKMSDKLEEEAKQKLDDDWAGKEFDALLQSQKDSYTNDASAFETAFDGMSDTSFILAAPQSVDPETGGKKYDSYGYVINILLPFSELQTQMLGEFSSDYGDEKGNSFAARTMLLGMIRATDQRGTWFTGHEDYSFEAGEDAYKGDGSIVRDRLFFENSFAKETENAKYETLKNYYGKYTYNGTVTETDGEYKLTPKKIGIADFLSEMEGYVKFAQYGDGQKLGFEMTPKFADYYDEEERVSYYDENGDVDYSKFVYATGKITGDDAFDPNKIFVAGSWENTAMSVINELSFAYNTDTAGLNTYLGYSISPDKTSYMAEFEYAAQEVCKEGAGSFAVVPTDYGWHIIYCTFSFADVVGTDGGAFKFVPEDIETEGSFSNLYFETLKSTTVSTYATNRQTEAINTYVDACSTIYTAKFQDLLDLGK